MENDFKWRVVISESPTWGNFYLEPTMAAVGLDSTYLHKPGDIDYSPIACLPVHKKAEILYYVATGANPEGIRSSAVDIAACILVDQLSIPAFIPEVLNPHNWTM